MRRPLRPVLIYFALLAFSLGTTLVMGSYLFSSNDVDIYAGAPGFRPGALLIAIGIGFLVLILDPEKPAEPKR